MIVVRGALQFEIIYNRRVIVVSSGRLIDRCHDLLSIIISDGHIADAHAVIEGI